MKKIVRNISIYTFALFLLPKLIPGVHLTGGLWTLFVGGIGLALMFLIIKPILTLISFPVNILSLGLFSMLTNALILYLLTIIVTGVSVEAFTYQRFEIWGFVIPALSFNTFFSYVYTAFVLSFIDTFLSWLMK
jgi:putative membrane protein